MEWLNFIFNKNTNLSQKFVFENIVYVSRYWEKKTWCLNSCFSRGFRQFLSEFSIFLKERFIAVIPKKRNRLLCIEKCEQCWKYKAYDEYIRKNGTKRKKVKTRNFLLNYLRYRYSDQITVYLDCNRIKGSFD